MQCQIDSRRSSSSGGNGCGSGSGGSSSSGTGQSSHGVVVVVVVVVALLVASIAIVDFASSIRQSKVEVGGSMYQAISSKHYRDKREEV